MHLFARKPIADLQPPGEDAHSLKRVLGAGDLVMLAIGAVIGAGIFGAIGTAAAGQIGPNGDVIRYGAGPALIFSFVLLGAACALAALCYAELASTTAVARNPSGPATSFDPSEPGVIKRVHRGGSFLCTDQYCSRYMVGTRGKGDVGTATNHLGFRLVKGS